MKPALRSFLAEVAVVLLWSAVALQADRALAARAGTPAPHPRVDIATVAMPTMTPSHPTTEIP